MTFYLYLDTETTDLEVLKGHQVTEIAYILEDQHRNTLAERLLFVEHDRDRVGEWRRTRTDYCQRTEENWHLHQRRVHAALCLFDDVKTLCGTAPVLVGTNPAFDQDHLKPLFHEADLPLPWQFCITDIKAMALALFPNLNVPPPQYQINKLLGFANDNKAAHTALEDVRECRRLFHALMDRRGK